MVEEVQGLLDRSVSPEDLIYYGLEYKYLTLYLTGVLRRDEMVEKLNVAIHRFAKPHMTLFPKMDREGFEIRWLDGHLELEENASRVLEWLARGR
jgi:tRNA dimethylallyltransferase